MICGSHAGRCSGLWRILVDEKIQTAVDPGISGQRDNWYAG